MKILFVDGAEEVDGYTTIRISLFNVSAGHFSPSWYSDLPGKREFTKIVVIKQKRMFDTICILAHEIGHYLIWKFISKRRYCRAHVVYDDVAYFLMKRR